MSARRLTGNRLRTLGGGLLLTCLLAGCGSSVGLGLSSNGADSTSGDAATMSSNSSRSTDHGAATNLSSGSSTGMSTSAGDTASMNMSPTSVNRTTVPQVNGIRPVTYRALSTSYWQGMKIEAMTTTPTSFMVYNGTTATGKAQYSEVRATRSDSFHLMVMLSDQHTGVLIPYATVWATIYNAKGRIVFSERQWPMISAYMGSHYGDNVPHLGAGRYTLKLLITPPQVARHLEYKNVWQKIHDVTTSFTWKPTA